HRLPRAGGRAGRRRAAGVRLAREGARGAPRGGAPAFRHRLSRPYPGYGAQPRQGRRAGAAEGRHRRRRARAHLPRRDGAHAPGRFCTAGGAGPQPLQPDRARDCTDSVGHPRRAGPPPPEARCAGARLPARRARRARAARSAAAVGVARAHALATDGARPALPEGGFPAAGQGPRRPGARCAARRGSREPGAAVSQGVGRAREARRRERWLRPVPLAARGAAGLALRTGAEGAGAGLGQAPVETVGDSAPMNVAGALLYGFANLLHPRMLWLMVWPMLVSLVFWGAVAAAFWDRLAAALGALVPRWLAPLAGFWHRRRRGSAAT